VGYRAPASELPGVTTLVTDRSKKGLPPTSSFPQDKRYPLRPDQAQEEDRIQLLPLPSDFRQQRERNRKAPPAQYQKPGTPEEDPEGRSLSEDKVRTLGIPGEEWGNPVNDQGIRSPRRRPSFVAGDDIQHDQRGKAKRYQQEYYRSHRSEKNQAAKQWYRRNRNNPQSERRRDKREDNPKKYERRPGGGYSDPADRTQDWREEHKEGTGTFYREVENRSDNADRWNDRATIPEPRVDHRPTPNHQEYDHTGEPGSAKVIPTFNTDLVNHQDNREWGQRLATLISDVEAATEPLIHERASGLPTKLKRVNRKNAILTYTVTGSSGVYTVKVKIPRKGNLRDPKKLDVWLSCSCPYWRWQGPEHHAKVRDYLYGKPRGTASKPVIKDPSGIHGACKHVLAVFQDLKRMEPVRRDWGKRASSSRVALDYLMVERVMVRYLQQGGR
jgi:hypothetical protein